jgi:hypothetical protein
MPPDNSRDEPSVVNEFQIPGQQNWGFANRPSRKERHDNIRRIVVYGALLVLAALYLMLFIAFTFLNMTVERFTTGVGALVGLQTPVLAIAGYFFFRRSGDTQSTSDPR